MFSLNFLNRRHRQSPPSRNRPLQFDSLEERDLLTVPDPIDPPPEDPPAQYSPVQTVVDEGEVSTPPQNSPSQMMTPSQAQGAPVLQYLGWEMDGSTCIIYGYVADDQPLTQINVNIAGLYSGTCDVTWYGYFSMSFTDANCPSGTVFAQARDADGLYSNIESTEIS
ncbi:hypothetical protein [Anatilimnocola floriformis]|uniref:hypothetical protein n=1 Tax=Anatilimnocola floriformis TaxID=2948575 RepID=UPI0020C2195F|nr:hypothetical protein [Anatilimnocola floriformis]